MFKYFNKKCVIQERLEMTAFANALKSQGSLCAFTKPAYL